MQNIYNLPWNSTAISIPLLKLLSYLAPNVVPSSISLEHTPLLVSGPSGYGKRRIINIISKILGIHCVEFNAYDIIGSTEFQTELNLKSMVFTFTPNTNIYLDFRSCFIMCTMHYSYQKIGRPIFEVIYFPL